MMNDYAIFRFYDSLNDFLPLSRRQQDFQVKVRGHPAIKDTIEAIGVPHPEVALILANGQPVDFTYSLQNDDRFSVYPHWSRLPLDASLLLRPPLENYRFVLDVHLGKLATYLRLLGFDSWYRQDSRDEDLAAISDKSARILLTRDKGLLKRSRVTYGYWVRATNPTQQTQEVLQRFTLQSHIRPFQRCLRCNGELVSVEKEEIVKVLPPKTRQVYDQFFQCQTCQQVYWQGSHYADLQQLVAQFSNSNSSL